MTLKKTAFLLFFLGCFAIRAQTNKPELNVYTFKEIEKLQLLKPKPVLIFIYTDWCKICYGMKNTTLKNKEVISILNSKFYFVKLNAETKKEITFLGNKFNFIPSGTQTGIHQLAKDLATINGKISYPTITILNTKFEIDIQIDSYINSKKMEKILKKYLDIK